MRRSPEKLTGGNRRAGQTGVAGCGHGPSFSPLSCEPGAGPRCRPVAAAASPWPSAGAAPPEPPPQPAPGSPRRRGAGGGRDPPRRCRPLSGAGRSRSAGQAKGPAAPPAPLSALGSRAYLVTGTREPPCQRLPSPPPFPSLPFPASSRAALSARRRDPPQLPSRTQRKRRRCRPGCRPRLSGQGGSRSGESRRRGSPSERRPSPFPAAAAAAAWHGAGSERGSCRVPAPSRRGGSAC